MAAPDCVATRSFGGCDTCRGRRVKCDETRPVCRLCTATGLLCRGYGKNIFFTSEAGDCGDIGGEGIRFRRLLFTEAEREEMSLSLTSSVPPKLVSRQISCLDAESETFSPDQDLDLQRGPFGVFTSRTLREAQIIIPDDDFVLDWNTDIEPLNVSDALEDTQEIVLHNTTTIGQWSNDLISTIFDSSMQTLLPAMGDATDINQTLHLNVAGRGFCDAIPIQNMQLQDFDAYGSSGTELNMTGPLPNHHLTQEISQGSFVDDITAPGVSSVTPSSTVMPEDAIFLLKHYTSSIINFLTPFEHAKTPWHILFIPHVKSCLAALTMGEDLGHASLAIFFGTLSISASSLGNQTRSQSNKWQEQAKTYERKARENCRMMLETAYRVPKVAKYKTTLMALLTLIHLYTVNGKRKSVDFYFIEAEKLIRVRGLGRVKSRKVRLLHHCYVFQRMFYESLCIGRHTPHRREAIKTIESSGSGVYSRDSLTFRASQWHNLPQAMLTSKTKEEGENDLHLEHPGIWPETLYPEIYGIPEKLIWLLSCTIRLGNEKDSAGHDVQSGVSVVDFLRRAKALEWCIKQYQEHSDDLIAQLPQIQATKQENLTKVIRAVRNAVSIYFYRRIYDVESSLLQPLVVNVLESLKPIQPIETGSVCGSLSFVWPAFIAACEAEDSVMRTEFADWFETRAKHSGLDTFAVTIGTIKTAWRVKSSSNDIGISWIDMAKGVII